MYNLGEHFQVDHVNMRPLEETIIKGNKYRFTILNEGLIRLEYNELGKFVDEPTVLVKNRNFPKIDFQIKEDKKYLELTTSCFKLYYTKEKNFKSSSNLKIEILNTNKVWYYKHSEVKNYPTYVTLENSKLEKVKSLYSLDGFTTINDAGNKIVNPDGTLSDNSSTVDLYLFIYLNDFDKCLKDYFTLTGYPSLIPRYALGNWWSKNTSYNDASLKELIDNFNEYKIPLSIILLDNKWHITTHKSSDILKTGFTFNKDNFKAPHEMISYLHNKGIRIGLNICPTDGIASEEEYYEQAAKYLEPNKNIIPFNVFDPKFIDVYLKLFIHPLDALGVDFYWLDTENKRSLDGYLLKNYQFYDMTRNYKRRPMIFGYNNGIAEHRFPVMYAGKTIVDWESLKQIPIYNATSANLGLSFWAHDIGGYYKGIEDNELYIRYVQLGTFSPILKFGSDTSKYYKREPWRWNLKTLSITTDYLQLRHKLIPYLYSESYNYHKYGTPLIKPIYYNVPEMYDDPIYSSEYYFGSQFFVTPITNKKDYIMNRVVHRFYMPTGTWYDFFTGKKFPGNHEYVSFYKDQHYPVFAKAGSIIPMSMNENINDTTPPKDMEIHFFPGVNNEYLLYEDDGISDLYKKGFYLLTKIEYNYLPNNYTVIIRAIDGKSGIVPEYRNYKLVFRDTKHADDVIVYDGKEKIECNSYTSGPDFIVEIKNVKTIDQLTVNCKGKDIEIDATHLINNDIEGILEDLPIETLLKEKIDKVLFSDLSVKKKRIEVRKLGNKGLEKKFVKLFLNLLEYVSKV